MSFPHIWTNTQRLVFFVKFKFCIFCLGIVVYLVWFLCFFCRIICVCFMLPVIKKLFHRRLAIGTGFGAAESFKRGGATSVIG